MLGCAPKQNGPSEVAQQFLEGGETFLNEVTHPLRSGFVAAAGQVQDVLRDAEVAHRVDLHGNGIGELADPVLRRRYRQAAAKTHLLSRAGIR